MTSPSIQAADKKKSVEKAQPSPNNDRSLAEQARGLLPVAPVECNCTPFSAGLFSWMRIFRFTDALMRQGC